MKNNRILLVDDTEANLDYLRTALGGQHRVVTCATGEEAVQAVEASPADFDFVVIDQLLGSGIDGIETAGKISAISDDIFILVFSNVAAASKEELERHRYDAFAAGAHRYLDRGTNDDPKIKVEQFVEEMSQLARLRDRLNEYYDERQSVPSLVTQLDLGVDVVDRSYKVWLMNQAMRRITGVGPKLPTKRCSAWHGYTLCPCPGCLVNDTFNTGEARDRLFLAPLRDDKLTYTHVWTQPVTDEHGNVLLAGDNKPLAVMETVHELSGDALLKAVPFDKRIKTIARAIQERLRNGFVRTQPFKKVAIYSVDPTEHGARAIALRAIAGYGEAPTQGIGAPFLPGVVRDFERVVDAARANGAGVFDDTAKTPDPIDDLTPTHWINWAVLDHDENKEEVVALLRVSGTDLREDDFDLLEPYVAEILRAIDQTRVQHDADDAKAERALIQVDNVLQTVASPEEALQVLVTEACSFTGSYLGHLRERHGNHARLVRIAARDFDGYESIARSQWPLTHRQSWSVRTILSGIEQHRRDITGDDSEISSQRRELSPQMRTVLEDSRSFCFEPLIFDNACIGALGFHSRSADAYSEANLWYLRQIAQRAALALHDLQMKREAEERLENVRTDVVQLLLHNIRNPLGAIRNWIQIAKEHVEGELIDCDEVVDALEHCRRDCDRLGRIRNEFGALFKPLDSRREVTELRTLIFDSVTEMLPEATAIDTKYDFDPELNSVVIDGFVVRTCVEVLVQNAIDVLLSTQKADATLKIDLRIAQEDEASHLSTKHQCLAVDVVDNGPGILGEERSKLFQIIKTKKAQGMGIGLARCRRFARLSGGDVRYDPSYTEGTKFVLILPFEPAEKGQ